MQFRFLASALLCLSLSHLAHADGPSDNHIDNVRRIPPPGVAIPDADRVELRKRADNLKGKIDRLADTFVADREQLELLPDVEVFFKAVDWALRFDEFYSPKQTGVASELLRIGMERAAQLEDGDAPWTRATGLVVRGYRSKIDGSVQPYGLVVPESVADSPGRQRRLDFWFHGRGEKLTELDFINQRLRSPGQFTPRDAFVLHLYGRYCNANKFAGEVDLFEAFDHARKSYAIDENRLVVRGFSMGGASCWQFATHFAGRWAAAAPGAGFSETPEFLNVFQKETLVPTAWEQKLWHWYNATDYALNLYHCPTVAYNGEIDRQKQAADAMERALGEEGMALTRIVGAGMGHRYDDASTEEISRRIDAIAERGRDPLPREVRFTTFTLRYNRMHWIVLEGLERHWERARVTARLEDEDTVRIETENVSHLAIEMEPGLCPLDVARRPVAVVDGTRLTANPVMSDRSWETHFRKADGKWETFDPKNDVAQRKRPGLQGPIDDAFMDGFVIVRPTGTPMNPHTGEWAASELDHAVEHWRRQVRGELRVVDDVDLPDDDIRDRNVVLFGDPRSNAVLNRVFNKLPVTWSDGRIVAGSEGFDADHHMIAAVYPNPLNPDRYVVLNSGVTFREYDYLNNARQVPKLPDWAVIDIDEPATSRTPGGIAAAGFFNENWRVSDPR